MFVSDIKYILDESGNNNYKKKNNIEKEEFLKKIAEDVNSLISDLTLGGDMDIIEAEHMAIKKYIEVHIIK